MNPVMQKTVDAIRADPFALATIEATRAFIYGHFRDWTLIGNDGHPVFLNDDAATGYIALSALLDTEEPPDLGDDTIVDIGGIEMSIGSIEALAKAMQKT